MLRITLRFSLCSRFWLPGAARHNKGNPRFARWDAPFVPQDKLKRSRYNTTSTMTAPTAPPSHRDNASITATPLAAFDWGGQTELLFRLLGTGGTACRGAWLRRVR